MKSVRFRHFYHAINHHACIVSSRTVTEQPVLASQGHRSDRVFRWIVAQAAPSVFGIYHQRVFSISDISHCTIHMAALFRPLCIQPADKTFHYRFFIFQATLVYLGIGQPFCFIAPLVLEQLVTIQDTLDCRMAVVLIMTVWNGLDQISPDMCITAAPAYLL